MPKLPWWYPPPFAGSADKSLFSRDKRPLKIHFDVGFEGPTRMGLCVAITSHGGTIVKDSQSADIIISNGGPMSTRTAIIPVLDSQWLVACAYENVILGEDRDWGGFRRPQQVLMITDRHSAAMSGDLVSLRPPPLAPGSDDEENSEGGFFEDPTDAPTASRKRKIPDCIDPQLVTLGPRRFAKKLKAGRGPAKTGKRIDLAGAGTKHRTDAGAADTFQGDTMTSDMFEDKIKYCHNAVVRVMKKVRSETTKGEGLVGPKKKAAASTRISAGDYDIAVCTRLLQELVRAHLPTYIPLAHFHTGGIVPLLEEFIELAEVERRSNPLSGPKTWAKSLIPLLQGGKQTKTG